MNFTEIALDIIIGTIGTGYFVYGKKMNEYMYMILGVLIIFFTYMAEDVVTTIVFGTILSISPLFLRKYF